MAEGTLDLFAGADAPSPSPARYKPAPALLGAAGRLLPEGISKTVLKTLPASVVDRLTHAVAVVALAKRESYNLALQGRSPDSFGWVGRDPELDAACSLLASHLFDSNLVPAAAEDDGGF